MTTKQLKYRELSVVRSVLKSEDQLGTFKCVQTMQESCSFICYADKITGPKRSTKITDRLTYTFANVICYITHNLCIKINTGETGKRLDDHFREHPRDVERNDKDTSKSAFPTSGQHRKQLNLRGNSSFKSALLI